MDTFRLATPADIHALVSIEQQAQSHPWDQGSLQGCFQAGDHISLFCHDTQIIGYIIFRPCLDEAEILNFAIEPAKQGQGFGRTLLNKGIEQMRALGIKKIFLEVRRSNQSAIALYQRVGFKQYAIRPEYYASENGREDALLFCLEF